MPSSLQGQQFLAIMDSLHSLTTNFRTDLEMWMIREPDAAYLFTQLVSWTDWSSVFSSEVAAEQPSKDNFHEFKNGILAAIDKIFVGMQSYSDNAKKLPDTVEDASWLTRSDKLLSASITSFQMMEVATEFEIVMDTISNLDAVEFRTAISLCIAFSPVIKQYYAICEHTIERYADLHAETCRLAHVLMKSFNQITSEGFCGPADSSSKEEENAGQVEQGTGLAEGEGAEDISKDVGDDEELSELAQQQRDDERKEKIDKEENAVDMGKDDLRGDMDEQGEANDDDDEEDGGLTSGSESADEDIEEETGSVDDLDPSAVDEKLWEGLADDKVKELENEDGAGKSTKDTAISSDKKIDHDHEPERVDDPDEGELEDEEENVGQPQAEMADPHLQQDQALELPEGMQLDGDDEVKEDSISDDGLDEFSDAHSDMEDGGPTEDAGDDEAGQVKDNDHSVKADDINEETSLEDTSVEAQADEDDIMEDQADSENDDRTEEDQHQPKSGESQTLADEFGGAEIGAAGEIHENENKNDAQGGSSNINPETDRLAATEEKQETSSGDPQGGASDEVADQGGKQADHAENRNVEAFKKLGDALERWHRQRREILQASDRERQGKDDVEMVDPDFEHVENEEDQGDNQALGGATKDQARALDEQNALEDPSSQLNDDEAPLDAHEPEDDMASTGLDQLQQEAMDHDANDRHPDSGAFISDSSKTPATTNPINGSHAVDEPEDINNDLSTIIASTTELPPLTPPSEAHHLWTHHSTLIQSLSLLLTEQLRLILQPTHASKLHGSFRTGKRLNLKRIIPYLASNHKRDKIWLRRTLPSKRNYQIMLCLDDSKSMTEGSAHSLALQTLALLAKSLSMLESGDLAVVGFGSEANIRVAHPFGHPFSPAHAGPNIYQHFSFQQCGTNVRQLLEQSIPLFRDARTNASGSSTSQDLWQLQLIISDGICEDHELIRRLVRRAGEERIMIVFVVVDSCAARGNSILDLTQAVFEEDLAADSSSGGGRGEMKLKMKRYLDGFPFPYYVVVRRVEDLPGVLATALKGWFAEVVDVR
jgi:midasin